MDFNRIFVTAATFAFPHVAPWKAEKSRAADSAHLQILPDRLGEGTSVQAMAWSTKMQQRGVTLVGDLRANRWRYAISVLGAAMYIGLRTLGAGFWIALVVPVLLGAGLGFAMRRCG